MIETKQLVPSVYFDKSRDFQLLAHIYDVVFNYIKTNIDLIYNIPFSKNSDKSLIDLVSYTLGFKPRHKYNVEQLSNICSIISYILKNKCNKKSIEWAVKNLYKMEGLTFDDKDDVIIHETMESINNITLGTSITVKVINLYISKLQNISLLEDILDYVLPAGTLYRIINLKLQDNNIIQDDYSTYSNFYGLLRTNNQSVAQAVPIRLQTIGIIDNIYVPKANPLNDNEDYDIDQGD